jgi:hypothetical protein
MLKYITDRESKKRRIERVIIQWRWDYVTPPLNLRGGLFLPFPHSGGFAKAKR